MLRRIWKDFDGSIEYSLNIHEMAHFGEWIFIEYSGIFRELNIRPGNIQFARFYVYVLEYVQGRRADKKLARGEVPPLLLKIGPFWVGE